MERAEHHIDARSRVSNQSRSCAMIYSIYPIAERNTAILREKISETPSLALARGRVGEGASAITPILTFPRARGKEP